MTGHPETGHPETRNLETGNLETGHLEVVPGAGAVLHFGATVVWVGPAASIALVTYLVRGARASSGSPTGGRQLADQVAAILSSGDPEPGAPFVIVGAGEGGWGALLHGPVQLFDGTRWSTPTPGAAWLGVLLGQPRLAAAGPSGAAVTSPRPDSPYHLERGVVPGGGFVFSPGTGAPSFGAGTAPVPEPTGAAPPPVERSPAPTTPAATAPAATAPPSPPAPDIPPRPGVPAAPGEDSEAGPEPGPDPAQVPADPGQVPADPTWGLTRPGAGGRAGAAPSAAIDLRNVAPREGAPALRPVADLEPPTPGAPVVRGVNCGNGHFNHPNRRACLRCGAPIGDADRGAVSGPRPPLGVLVRDDSVVFSVGTGYVLGVAPETDPTVTGGLALPLALRGPGSDGISPSHAELRLSGWDVTVVDRGSSGGTFLLAPGDEQWAPLVPYLAHVLTSGTHVACGQRIVTYLSSWAG